MKTYFYYTENPDINTIISTLDTKLQSDKKLSGDYDSINYVTGTKVLEITFTNDLSVKNIKILNSIIQKYVYGNLDDTDNRSVSIVNTIPLSTDDFNMGYIAGSTMFVNNDVYMCIDSTVNNAIWIKLNNLETGPTGDVVGTSDTQTLTNKTINADSNTITNISNANIKTMASIDATKIADGSVNNTEFQYINTLTSNAQTQLNSKVSTSRTISTGVGLSGGGNLTANRTISMDINSLTVDSTPNGATDYVVTYDASASTHKKVLLNNLPSSGGSTSRKCDIYYKPSSELNLTTSWQDIPLNIERVKDTDFTHSANSAEITINTTDYYMVTARCTVYQTSGNNRSQAQMRIVVNTGSGYGEVPGSIGGMYSREVIEGQSTATVMVLLNLSAGDKIKVQAIRISGGNVALLSEGSSLVLVNV